MNRHPGERRGPVGGHFSIPPAARDWTLVFAGVTRCAWGDDAAGKGITA